MRIVRFSTPNNQVLPFQDQKISLSKLSQVKAHSILQISQSGEAFHQNYNNLQPRRQSHIKWISQIPVSKAIIEQICTLISTQQPPSTQDKKVPRRKIFKQAQHCKQNTQIPTFSQIPSKNTASKQQTKFYSIIMNSPRQSNRDMLGIKASQSKSKHQRNKYNCPFKTNQQNQNYSYSHRSSVISYSSSPMIQKSSLIQLTQNQIPKLQWKLRQHEKQLKMIKKYMEGTQKLDNTWNKQKYNNLSKSMKKHSQTRSMMDKAKTAEQQRKMLLKQIQRIKEMGKISQQKANEEANQQIELIQNQRLQRLQSMQKQNEMLQEDLKSHEYNRQSQQFKDYQYEDFDQFKDYQGYEFKVPAAFPSKDWQSYSQIIIPTRKSKHCNAIGQLQISSNMQKKMKQISSIEFTNNNKGDQFSIQVNTFRQIMSPLEFQGGNGTW